jgi:hypothetical protein
MLRPKGPRAKKPLGRIPLILLLVLAGDLLLIVKSFSRSQYYWVHLRTRLDTLINANLGPGIPPLPRPDGASSPVLEHFHDPPAQLTNSTRPPDFVRVFPLAGLSAILGLLARTVKGRDGNRCQVSGCPSRLSLHAHRINSFGVGNIALKILLASVIFITRLNRNQVTNAFGGRSEPAILPWVRNSSSNRVAA